VPSTNPHYSPLGATGAGEGWVRAAGSGRLALGEGSCAAELIGLTIGEVTLSGELLEWFHLPKTPHRALSSAEGEVAALRRGVEIADWIGWLAGSGHVRQLTVHVPR
jgi:hypothetical protein